MMRSVVEKVVDAKLSKAPKMPSELVEKILLLSREACGILRISPSTLYELQKDQKLVGFKIKRRRYFARTDVEKLMRWQYM